MSQKPPVFTTNCRYSHFITVLPPILIRFNRANAYTLFSLLRRSSWAWKPGLLEPKFILIPKALQGQKSTTKYIKVL